MMSYTQDNDWSSQQNRNEW